MKPFFSIIVTGRNALSYLKECLDSVIMQDFTDFECLICDDASTDGSAISIDGWIAKYGDPRFRLFANVDRIWSPSTLRMLILQAQGDVIVKLDLDDYFTTPSALSRIKRAYDSNPLIEATNGSFTTVPRHAAWPLSLLPPNYPWWESWSVSHVLTFKRALSLASLSEEWDSAAYKDASGAPYHMAGDVAIYMPVMFRAKAVAYIKDVLMAYRFHDLNDQHTDRQSQLATEERICGYWTKRVMERMRSYAPVS